MSRFHESTRMSSAYRHTESKPNGKCCVKLGESNNVSNLCTKYNYLGVVCDLVMLLLVNLPDVIIKHLRSFLSHMMIFFTSSLTPIKLILHFSSFKQATIERLEISSEVILEMLFFLLHVFSFTLF